MMGEGAADKGRSGDFTGQAVEPKWGASNLVGDPVSRNKGERDRGNIKVLLGPLERTALHSCACCIYYRHRDTWRHRHTGTYTHTPLCHMHQNSLHRCMYFYLYTTFYILDSLDSFTSLPLLFYLSVTPLLSHRFISSTVTAQC